MHTPQWSSLIRPVVQFLKRKQQPPQRGLDISAPTDFRRETDESLRNKMIGQALSLPPSPNLSHSHSHANLVHSASFGPDYSFPPSLPGRPRQPHPSHHHHHHNLANFPNLAKPRINIDTSASSSADSSSSRSPARSRAGSWSQQHAEEAEQSHMESQTDLVMGASPRHVTSCTPLVGAGTENLRF